MKASKLESNLNPENHPSNFAEKILPYGAGLASFIVGGGLGFYVSEELSSRGIVNLLDFEHFSTGLNTGVVSAFLGYFASKNLERVADEIKILPYEIIGSFLGYFSGKNVGGFISKNIFPQPQDHFPFYGLAQGIQDTEFSLAGTLLATPLFFLGRRLGKKILKEYRKLNGED